jgi:hypothetical protein
MLEFCWTLSKYIRGIYIPEIHWTCTGQLLDCHWTITGQVLDIFRIPLDSTGLPPDSAGLSLDINIICDFLKKSGGTPPEFRWTNRSLTGLVGDC